MIFPFQDLRFGRNFPASHRIPLTASEGAVKISGGLHRGRPKLRFAPSLGRDDTLQAQHLGRKAATYREATEGGGCDVFRDLSGLVESKLGWSGTGLNYIQWLL